MELTVIRESDGRRMVVAVTAADENEALRTIQNAIGTVTVARDSPVVRSRRQPFRMAAAF
ncbi:hypothetical protein [Leifsonia virtsii]|uniref:Uncharacterized protein n=1 Tax=Leifsonia virtsii TaxID=3035915 RepID=A0ABT8J2T4_9MICO|nr:hypothetical protein [Leifsonia virtsii]MDN4599188.1 hypothetical protein [Leifsonia virtsii]